MRRAPRGGIGRWPRRSDGGASSGSSGRTGCFELFGAAAAVHAQRILQFCPRNALALTCQDVRELAPAPRHSGEGRQRKSFAVLIFCSVPPFTFRGRGTGG